MQVLSIKNGVNNKKLGKITEITKNDIGLSAVDNTADLDKPISNATQTALNNKSNVSVSATGTATDEVQYITVDGVEKKLAGGGGGAAVWGSITGTLSNQTDLNTALNAKSTVTVSATGTATDEVSYITVDGVEKKLPSGGGGAAVWGSITGTLSNQTDLNTALTNKQNKVYNQTTEPTTAVAGDIWTIPGGPGTEDTYLATGVVTNNTLTLTNNAGTVINFTPTYTKADVGLGNVDNTSDADKPVSTAIQTALDAKQNTISSGTAEPSGGSDGDVYIQYEA